MKKVDLNKKQKKESLLDSAFLLFTKNGFQKTSISDIVISAGVAKGTFYLYFKDKYDLRNHLITHKASQLFQNAYMDMKESNITSFEEQIIFMVDHILNQFALDKNLVRFISKHLSWGFFKNSLVTAEVEDSENILDIYLSLLEHSGKTYRNPEVMMYMIIELVSGTSYNSILYDEPLSLNELKPYIYDTIRNIMKREEITPD